LEVRACVEYRELEKFSNSPYSTGGSHKRLGPGVIYLLLSISMELGALIYALINALKKLMHCVNALKKINALTALVKIVNLKKSSFGRKFALAP